MRIVKWRSGAESGSLLAIDRRLDNKGEMSFFPGRGKANRSELEPIEVRALNLVTFRHPNETSYVLFDPQPRGGQVQRLC